MIAKSAVLAPLFYFCLCSTVAQTPSATSMAASASGAIQTPSASPTTSSAMPVYQVFAIRYASIPGFPLNALIAGADPQRKLSIAMTVWLIRGNGRNILVDSGFYRPQFFKQFKVEGFIKPSDAVSQPGITGHGKCL